jgi:hypothetical protein
MKNVTKLSPEWLLHILQTNNEYQIALKKSTAPQKGV